MVKFRVDEMSEKWRKKHPNEVVFYQIRGQKRAFF